MKIWKISELEAFLAAAREEYGDIKVIYDSCCNIEPEVIDLNGDGIKWVNLS